MKDGLKKKIREIITEMEDETDNYIWEELSGDILKEDIETWITKLEKILGEEE